MRALRAACSQFLSPVHTHTHTHTLFTPLTHYRTRREYLAKRDQMRRQRALERERLRAAGERSVGGSFAAFDLYTLSQSVCPCACVRFAFFLPCRATHISSNGCLCLSVPVSVSVCVSVSVRVSVCVCLRLLQT